MRGSCKFCTAGSAPLRVRRDEGSEEDVFVCAQCWALLKDPATALPLIRGDLMLSLRGTMSEERLKRTVDAYMDRLAGLRRKA